MHASVYFRRDIFAVGASLLILGTALFFLPLTTTSVLTNSGFAYSGRNSWYQSGILYLPAGYSISLKIISGTPALVGLAGYSRWNQYAEGNLSTPPLFESISGTSGEMHFTARHGTLFYIVAMPLSGTSIPVLEFIIGATNPHGFAGYSMLAVFGGSVLIFLSFSYELLRKKADRRFRQDR